MINPIDRRTFIRRTVQTAIVAAAGGLPVLDLLSMPVQAGQAPPLAVRKGRDIPFLVRETINALGGVENFVKQGDVVVVKPNIGWDRTVELAANTHPEVVKTLVQLCLEAGAKQVRIFDRTCNDERRCYMQSGIRPALEAIRSDRVSIEYIDRRSFKELAIKGGRAFDRWEFYLPVIEADRLINVPIAKHHSISRLTLGMKNLMGVIGGNRGRLHHDIAESLSDIASVIHSDLTVVDATRILTANGPQGGRLQDVRKLDTLIASPDIVAADAYAATLFGLSPTQVPTVVAAARRGLGVMDLNQVRMV
ncbi:MAG: DUF362 domain-containing protein [Desulfuromonadales bacterium]|jgi:uncharacterized protein (DUF362 family)